MSLQVTDELTLERLAVHHAALPTDLLARLVETIPPGLANLIQARILRAIVQYRVERDKSDPDVSRWRAVYETLTQLTGESCGVFHKFWIQYYSLLVAREVQPLEAVLRHYTTAQITMTRIEEPLHQQLEALVSREYSKFLYDALDKHGALAFYTKATKNYVAWYRYLCTIQLNDEGLIRKGVAIQTWEMHHNFADIFPGNDIRDLGISERLLAELAELADAPVPATE